MNLFQIKIAIGVAAILTLACNSPREVIATPPVPGSQPIGVDPALVTLGYAPADASILPIEIDPLADLATPIEATEASTLLASIKRTKCYGKCPAYEAKVFANGLVLFEGEQHTGRDGLYEAYLLPNQIDSLMSQAQRIQYFELSQHYPPSGFTLSGLPSTITYLKGDVAEHKVTNNHNAPKELRKYERYFEGLLDELDWKPVLEH